MKQLSEYFLIWFMVIIVLGYIADRLQQQEIKVTSPTELPVKLQDLETSYRQAKAAYSREDYLATLRILDKSENAMRERQKVPAGFKLDFYRLKGAAHWSLWQYLDAEQAWLTAASYAVSRQQKDGISKLLHKTYRVLETVNKERNQKKTYLASPGTGPAARLTGKLVLIYIFIEDDDSHGWSLKNRTFSLNTWQYVQQWLTDRAAGYGESISFSKRLFVIDKHPEIRRLSVGDISSGFNNADRVVNLVARHFGQPNMLSFINAIKKEEQADQAMLMLHLGKAGRSFASRCMQSCSNLGEFVFLLEEIKTRRWQSLEYAQAHESLHLFGADDLYNIHAASRYAVKDIMNYPSSRLNASTLEDITAYGVGLRKTPPKTPFRIKTVSH